MLIEKGNLTIRNATVQDAERLSAWWNDGAIMAHAGFPNGTGQTANEIADSLVNDTDDTHRRLIIEVNQVPVGEMNYRNKGNQTAEIGIKICVFSEQNKGIGTQLLSLLINALFVDFKYEKIILDTNVKNLRAQHVYEKLGFRKLRVNVDSWTNQIGELQSSIDYDLTRDSFNNFAK